jgi:hypothetical protein
MRLNEIIPININMIKAVKTGVGSNNTIMPATNSGMMIPVHGSSNIVGIMTTAQK